MEHTELRPGAAAIGLHPANHQPIRALASETIDADAVLLGIALPGKISDRIAAAYDHHLFGKATLQDLTDEPRFVINATNVQSGALWRFMKAYMADYRVGMVERPTIPLSLAVAASSAFPPLLSPVQMRLKASDFKPNSGMDLQQPPFTTKVVLCDGGVYDNLGLETVWKNYETVLVSDAGGKLQAEEEPKTDWARHAYRVLELVDNQVRSLRKRQVIESYESALGRALTGASGRTSTTISLPDALDCPFEQTMELASTPTRLKRMDDRLQERLINWGYAVCDAGLRRHVDPSLMKPAAFPYPASGV